MSYSVFTRVWWKDNPSWPNGLEPYAGAPKHYLDRHVETEQEARNHVPGMECYTQARPLQSQS